MGELIKCDLTSDSFLPSKESELLKKKWITPEDVLRLPHITQGYLCEPCSSLSGVEFLTFSLRDVGSGSTLFQIKKPEDLCNKYEGNKNFGKSESFVRYQFSPSILSTRTLGAIIEFTTGEQELKSFRMIERHFYKDTLLKTFDIEFGLCIPNSCNTCEQIYHIPKLSPKLIQDMINNPFETRSDSFYFVDGWLAMHSKADYSYCTNH